MTSCAPTIHAWAHVTLVTQMITGGGIEADNPTAG